MKKWKHWHTLVALYNGIATTKKTVQNFLKNLKTKLPYNSRYSTSGFISQRIEIMISKRYLNSHVHDSLIHNSQDKETTFSSVHVHDSLHNSQDKETTFSFSSVQSLSCVWLFATLWTAALQASLSITNSQSLLKLISIESVMNSTISSSAVPFSSHIQSFPASESFPRSKIFASGGKSIGVSASVLPMNIQDWSPLGWTGWISLQSRGLSRVFSNTTVQKHQFFGTQLSLLSNSHIHT